MKVDLGAADRQVLEWSKQQNAAGPAVGRKFYGGLEQGSIAQEGLVFVGFLCCPFLLDSTQIVPLRTSEGLTDNVLIPLTDC
jgi:hypothetical protein